MVARGGIKMNHGLDNVAGDKDMKTFIEEIRLPDEKKILDYLEEVLSVSTINDLLFFHANQKKDRSLSKKMQFNLPLSPQVGGNLYALTQEILHLLNYTDRPVAFYISNDSGLYNTPQKLDRAIRWVIVCHNREGERIWQNKCGRVTMRLLKPKLPWKQ